MYTHTTAEDNQKKIIEKIIQEIANLYRFPMCITYRKSLIYRKTFNEQKKNE